MRKTTSLYEENNPPKEDDIKTRPSLLDVEPFVSLHLIYLVSNKHLPFNMYNERLFLKHILRLVAQSSCWV